MFPYTTRTTASRRFRKTLAVHRGGEAQKLLTPIQNHIHVRFCEILPALNYDNALPIR